MIEYTWKIGKILTFRPVDGQQNVVHRVRWVCKGVDGSYLDREIGTYEIEYNPNGTFTPYENLTEEQILNWVWSGTVNKTAVEATVAKRIDNQKNPPQMNNLPLPWKSN